MREMIRIEFERAYRSIGMTAALAVGFVIALIQFVRQVYPLRNNIITYFDGTYITYPFSVFNAWMGMDDLHPWRAVYLTIFPILAALPYAASYFDDKKSGYIKNVCIKVKKSSYLFAKYMAVFTAGGTTVVLPMLFNLLLSASVLPSLTPSMNGLFAPGSIGMYADIFYTKPYLYIAIYLFAYFIYGGVFASIALAAADFSEYRFIVLLFPFMLYYGTGIFSSVFSKNQYIQEIGMKRLLAMTQYRGISEYTFWGEALFIGILAFVIYFVRGMKNDIL